jgi:hypothetical protein
MKLACQSLLGELGVRVIKVFRQIESGVLDDFERPESAIFGEHDLLQK